MRRLLLLLAALIFAELTCAFETSMVIAGMEGWVEMSGSPVAAGWIVTIYLLVAASCSALCGRLGDLYGHREVLIGVLGVCSVGSVTSALSADFIWVIAGRALQGASGGIIPLVYALVREHFPQRHVPSCIGAIVATAAAGAAIGLLTGGMLTDRFGPQSVFFASMTMTSLSFVLTMFIIPASQRVGRPRRIDVLGGALLGPGVATLLLAISGVGTWGIGSTLVPVSGATGIVLLVCWGVHEWRHPDPLINVRLLLERQILLSNGILALLAVGSFQATLLMSMLIQQPTQTGIGLGTDATMVGIVKFPAMIAGLFASLWAGYICGKAGPRLPILLGCITTAGAILAALIFHGSLIEIGVVVLFINCGVLAVYAGVPNVILATVATDRTGEATGIMTVVRFIFSGVGAQVLVVLLSTQTMAAASGTSYPTRFAFILALAFMALTALCATALALRLRPDMRSQPAPESTIPMAENQRLEVARGGLSDL